MIDLNYIMELNAFYDRLELNPLPSPAIVLWHALLHIANKTGWQPEFTVAVSILMMKTGMNEKAIERARNTLVQAGLLVWKKRSGNRSALYQMVSLCDKTTYQIVGQRVGQVSDNVSDTLSDNVSELYKQKQKQKQISSYEDRAEPELPSVIGLPLNDKTEYRVTEVQVQEWSSLYPAVEVMQELRNMRGWLLANPDRRKTSRGVLKFVTTWLQKEQDKGRKGTATAPQKQNTFNAYPQRDYSANEYSDMERKLLSRGRNAADETKSGGTGKT